MQMNNFTLLKYNLNQLFKKPQTSIDLENFEKFLFLFQSTSINFILISALIYLY